MSNININAYNKLSAAFDYAQQIKNDPAARGGDSVVHLQDGNTLTCNYSKADAPKSLFHHAERSQDKKELNNATRDLFKQAVIDIFGTSINDVPKSVRSAMELGKFDGAGRPLTARRILAVNKAIEAELKAIAKSIGITGGGAAEILSAAAKGGDILETASPAATFKTRANRNATACVATSIASQASKAAKGQGANTFDVDFVRGMGVTVGGKRVNSRDPAVARDKIVQMLTGDKRSTFQGADDATKRKVNLLLSLMHQGTFGSILPAVFSSFDPASKNMNFSILEGTGYDGRQENSFSVSIDKGGNVTIKGEVKYTQCFQMPMGGMAPKFAGHDGSFAKFEGVIKIPAANLEDLANANWAECDMTESNDMEWDARNDDRFAKAADRIPEGFRFAGTVDVNMKIQVNAIRDGFDDL